VRRSGAGPGRERWGRLGCHGLEGAGGQMAEVRNGHVGDGAGGVGIVGAPAAVVWLGSRGGGLVIIEGVVGVGVAFVVGAGQGFDRGCVCNVGAAAVGQVVDKNAITRDGPYLGAIRLGPGAAVGGRKRTETDLGWRDIQRGGRGGLEPDVQRLHERAVAGDDFIRIVGAGGGVRGG
jgi:hypothetical protein